VPTYRIYYAEREVGDRHTGDAMSALPHYSTYRPGDYVSETEWEEEVDAPNTDGALDSFFKEHVRDNGELMWVDDDGESRPVEGVTYDADKTYIWVENGKLMEYQGLDEATRGMVSCPLCEGAGEVTTEVADEFLAEYGEEMAADDQEEERTTWG
jgi:hypothetical protein